MIVLANTATEREGNGSRSGSVKVEGVTKRYGSFEALANVSIDVVPGEFLALLGPSGSGKTTLLMTIAGFETPTEGHINIDGRDVTNIPPSKRNLGMVFQRYALFPHMSLRDNVAFPLRMRGVAKAERNEHADRMLATVGLEGYGSRLPAQLSGGQQQRVALARAIAYKPPVLLMDEPLSALDKNLREQMRIEIKHLQKSLGVTVVFVTHDQEEALVMADRIAVMNKGKIVQVGGPQELYERPESEFVAGFLGEANFFEGGVTGRDNDTIRLVLANGATIRGVATGADYGKNARLSVRPENISLNDEKNSQDGMEGRIKELIYAGSSTIALVDVGLPLPVSVRKTSALGLGPDATGKKVWLNWRVQDGRAFAFNT